jgi:succinyl-CoA synthetase beta subunit
MYDVLVKEDATLVEVNPLVLLTDGRVFALDAKVTVDDNALFRQPEIEMLRTVFPINRLEFLAREAGLQYVKLDGQVGIIGNGAGLVMSTLDVVRQASASAAGFLDVGGGARADLIATSLEVILSDPSVKSVLINIFGGITRCDLVARACSRPRTSRRRSPSSCGWTARTPTRAGGSWPMRRTPHHLGLDDARGCAESRGPRARRTA